MTGQSVKGLERLLKERGYSAEAIKEILKWYEENGS
jgi:SOS response regulatory protein OraA/RecX